MAIKVLTSTESGADSLVDINDNFALLAPIASPTFTGTPVLPTGTTGVTQSASDNSTKLATTEYVDTATSLQLTYVDIIPPAIHLTTADLAWEDWDISAVVPAGALYANIIIWQLDANLVGARKNGSSLARLIPNPNNALAFGPTSLMVEVDANRVIEIYGHTSSYSQFTVTGYWILA